jgi:hypothetical protein
MVGAVLVVVAMVLVLPAGLFAAGAVWSAILGSALDAEARLRQQAPAQG